jgi:hypothetical protein
MNYPSSDFIPFTAKSCMDTFRCYWLMLCQFLAKFTPLHSQQPIFLQEYRVRVFSHFANYHKFLFLNVGKISAVRDPLSSSSDILYATISLLRPSISYWVSCHFGLTFRDLPEVPKVYVIISCSGGAMKTLLRRFFPLVIKSTWQPKWKLHISWKWYFYVVATRTGVIIVGT